MKKLFTSKYELGLFVKVLSMVVVLISVTFSWFVFAKDAWVNPFDVGVVGVTDVTIADTVEGEWSDSLEIESTPSNGTLTEFSGNGDKLYIPVVENHEITKYYKPDYSQRPKDYIETVSYIKTNGPINLYLSEESYVLPVNEKNPKDYIAGAVRVAILIDNYKPLIWAPNPTFEYKDGTVKTNGDVEAN